MLFSWLALAMSVELQMTRKNDSLLLLFINCLFTSVLQYDSICLLPFINAYYYWNSQILFPN